MDHQQHIDELLERYLGLLDEYTRLREGLSQLLSGVYQNIARANFSGERGMRYGQDHYDERMKAQRILEIQGDDQDQPTFRIVKTPENSKAGAEPTTETEDDKGESQATEAAEKETKTTEKRKQNNNKNPLHWFGLFAPMPLRTAQTQAIQAVDKYMAPLMTVEAEMRALEIEVRRARKRRAKAEAAAQKQQQEHAKEPAAGTKAEMNPIEIA